MNQCDNCNRWTPPEDKSSPPWTPGTCVCPLPFWLTLFNVSGTRPTLGNQGYDCDMWEQRYPCSIKQEVVQAAIDDLVKQRDNDGTYRSPR